VTTTLAQAPRSAAWLYHPVRPTTCPSTDRTRGRRCSRGAVSRKRAAFPLYTFCGPSTIAHLQTRQVYLDPVPDPAVAAAAARHVFYLSSSS